METNFYDTRKAKFIVFILKEICDLSNNLM